MLVFEDSHGKLTVVGSDDLGLPTAPDSDVIVALLHLTKIRNDFTDPTVHFSRYELVDLLGWADNGQNYRRLDESLHRWVGVTLCYDGCWWDNAIKCRVDASFHIIDRVVIYDREVRHELQARQQPLPLSNFTWGKDFFDSCRANNLKRLDLDIYFGLKSAVSKQMYRFLDKRFYHRGDLTFDLREFALEHVGLARTYSDAGKLKAKLQPALEELEAIGFLEPMTAADRYSKTGRGAWNIRLVRKLPAPAEAKPAETKPPEPEPTGLEKELVERGVTRSVAADLVRDFPADRIRHQIEVVDWLRETKPKRVKDLGAYLADAIRKDFGPPAGFRSRAERAEAEATARARQEQQELARQTKAREREDRGPDPGVPGGADPRRAAAARRRGADRRQPGDAGGVRGSDDAPGQAAAPGRPARRRDPAPARTAPDGLTGKGPSRPATASPRPGGSIHRSSVPRPGRPATGRLGVSETDPQTRGSARPRGPDGTRPLDDLRPRGSTGARAPLSGGGDGRRRRPGFCSTQVLVKPPRVMERPRRRLIVRDEHPVGLILVGRRPGSVPWFHGLAVQDQGGPLPDHLGHFEMVLGPAGNRHHQVIIPIDVFHDCLHSHYGHSFTDYRDNEGWCPQSIPPTRTGRGLTPPPGVWLNAGFRKTAAGHGTTTAPAHRP